SGTGEVPPVPLLLAALGQIGQSAKPLLASRQLGQENTQVREIAQIQCIVDPLAAFLLADESGRTELAEMLARVRLARAQQFHDVRNAQVFFLQQAQNSQPRTIPQKL